MGQKCVFVALFAFFENVLKQYQNRIRITSKSPQDRIKSESKPCQNHIRPIKFLEKAYPMVVSVSFFQANPSGTLRKRLHSQTISNSHPKPYLNHNPDHIQVITKPYQSHNPKFKAYRLSQPYLKIISKPYQNKFKKVPS